MRLDKLACACINGRYCWIRDGKPDPMSVEQTVYELADFDPTTSHLHTCMAEGDPEAGCMHECAGHLYAIAEDAEKRARE